MLAPFGTNVWGTVWISRKTHGLFSDAREVYSAWLPFTLCLDQIVDALTAFHMAHPAFHILLSIPAPSMPLASLTHALPKELQTSFELGFQVRAPNLP